jgi:hypothetical protein
MSDKQTTVASSKDEACISYLLMVLERKFETFKFKIVNGYHSSIFVDRDELDPDIRCIIDFCDGYVSGWESGIEEERSYRCNNDYDEWH